MTSASGPGHGSPMIAGALHPNTDFHDFSEDELAASNVFNFADSPDTLQTLESAASANSKDAAAAVFLNPQQLAAGPLPDSPNSYHDDSSESAESSKRADSSVSYKTPASTTDASMADTGDVKMEWGHNGYGSYDDDDAAFNFGSAADSSHMTGMYAFDAQDDSFMDQSFDFESASSSPDAVSAGPLNVASPGMPTIKSNSTPNKTKPASKQKPTQKKDKSVS